MISAGDIPILKTYTENGSAITFEKQNTPGYATGEMTESSMYYRIIPTYRYFFCLNRLKNKHSVVVFNFTPYCSNGSGVAGECIP